MQSVSTQFASHATGQLRPISWGLTASFDKVYDSGIIFFTLNTSLLSGTDVLPPSDSNAIAYWDKYSYVDYSDRVISLETTREVIEPYSVVQSYADIVLNNYDDYFTPNSGSPIDSYILPKRPFRILMGFGGENVPVFVGLSSAVPTIDKVARTASFHLVDFLSLIFGTEIIESTMILGSTTSDILATLFQSVGLTSDDYNLDHSFNTIPFFFVSKGDSLGSVIQNLMEAEQGRLYLNELGIIIFLNRQNYDNTVKASFDKSNTIDYQVSTGDDIINDVQITCDIMGVQPSQSVWSQLSPILVAPGDTIEIWANLLNPATNVTTPTYSSVTIQDSYYTTSMDITGIIPYTDTALIEIDLFGTAAKLTFENTGSENSYIYAIDLWGTPVTINETIMVEESDSTSIDKFEQKILAFETKYIQEKDNAVTKASIIVDDYKSYGSLVNLDVKGNPALQIDDGIDLDLDGYQGTHIITKVINIMSGGGFNQQLRAKVKNPRIYFILNQSELNGSDELEP